MKENDNELEILAQALMEYETLTGEEIKEVLAGKKLTAPSRLLSRRKNKQKFQYRKFNINKRIKWILKNLV